MKNLIVLLLLIIPLYSIGQIEYGWRVYKTDSLKIEKYREANLIRSTGQYKNGQIKYTRYLKETQIQDTISYFSQSGSVLSNVNYNTLSYELFDSAQIANYNFVDSCIHLAKKQMEYSFGKTNILEYVFFDASNSHQQSSRFDNYSVASTKLYEPQQYPIKACWILYNSRIDKPGKPSRNIISFRIDSTLQIVQSNIDLKKQYQINYDQAYANAISLKNNFISSLDKSKKRGTKITRPYLEFRNKKLYWIIHKQVGTLISDQLEFMENDKNLEEISINVETGKVEKYLKPGRP